jgi:hypothetical protein
VKLRRGLRNAFLPALVLDALIAYIIWRFV